MPKVSVYLPDDLYEEAKAMDVSLSAITQEALRVTMARQRVHHWVERVRERPERQVPTIDTTATMAAVHDEFGQ